jgi:hypothetical protein
VRTPLCAAAPQLRLIEEAVDFDDLVVRTERGGAWCNGGLPPSRMNGMPRHTLDEQGRHAVGLLMPLVAEITRVHIRPCLRR